MSKTSSFPTPRSVLATSAAAGAAAIAVVLAVLGGMALAQQDKYTLKVPGGLEFSEFRGYEGWQVVSTSQSDKLVAVILANPVMIDAYLAGIPGNGDSCFVPESHLRSAYLRSSMSSGVTTFARLY